MMEIIVKSVETTVYKGTATQVILPGLHGTIGIKPNHANTAVILTKGVISIKTNNSLETINIESGLAQITPQRVDILLATYQTAA
jgi:F0F1-type ATP synthase epsilon subunit